MRKTNTFPKTLIVLAAMIFTLIICSPVYYILARIMHRFFPPFLLLFLGFMYLLYLCYLLKIKKMKIFNILFYGLLTGYITGIIAHTFASFIILGHSGIEVLHGSSVVYPLLFVGFMVFGWLFGLIMGLCICGIYRWINKKQKNKVDS
jgi:hypothetical protein